MATVLAFHAHPDDEALVTGGVLAKAAAEGHRVIVAVATDGGMGTAAEAEPRMRELRASAAILGAQRVVSLGYAGSGSGPILYPDPPDRTRFVRADTNEAAERLAGYLREEAVDVLLSYDAGGGYGHPDHVRVHEIGRRAAELARVPRVLEATLPRERVIRLLTVLRILRIRHRYDETVLRRSFTPRAAITHRINVRPFARQKRQALAAHRSQVLGAGRLAPAMRIVIRLPAPIFGLFLGTEWFVDATRDPRNGTYTDIFGS